MKRLASALALTLTGCAAPSPSLPPGAVLGFERWVASAAAAPSAQPGDVAVRLPASPSPSTAPSGGRGGGPAAGAPAGPPAIARMALVLDAALEAPLSGVTVTAADGSRAVTDAGGRFTPAASGPLVLTAPGYATSVVLEPAGCDRFHLRRADGRGEAHDARTTTLTGQVAFPGGQPFPGVAVYQDAAGSFAAPAVLDGSGRFSLTVEARTGASPRGAVLVLAGPPGLSYYGVSAPVAPFAAPGPIAVALAPADRTVAYSGDNPPRGLVRLEARLELQLAGLPPVVLEGAAGATGTFQVPAPGALPGALRVSITASDMDGDMTSRLGLPVGERSEVRGTFLPVPGLEVEAEAEGLAIRWEDAGATGYRLESRADYAPGPLWEAWSPAAGALVIPSAALPAPGEGEVRLEAIEAPGLTSRRVAGLRQLRIEPWSELAEAHRVATRRVRL